MNVMTINLVTMSSLVIRHTNQFFTILIANLVRFFQTLEGQDVADAVIYALGTPTHVQVNILDILTKFKIWPSYNLLKR